MALRGLLTLILTLGLLSPLWGQTDPGPSVHPLPASGVIADIKTVARYRIDPAGELSPEDLYISDEGFQPFDPILDESAPRLWLKLTLIAPNEGPSDYVLRVSRRFFRHFELYTPNDTGRLMRRSATITGAIDAETVGREYVFPLRMDSGERHTLLIDVETLQHSLQPLAMVIEDGPGFAAKKANAYLLYGLIFGILLALIFHNFALYLNLRQPGHLYYVLAMSCTLLLLGVDSGMLQTFLLPDLLQPWVGRLNALFAVMLVTSIFLFFQAFVDGVRYAPKLTRAIVPFLVLAWVLMLIEFIAPTRAVAFIQLVMIAVMLLLTVSSFIAARKGSMEGAIFLAAWSIYVINAIVRGMLSFDMSSANPIAEHLMYFAAVVEASILALGLSYRVRVLYERHATALKEQHKAAMLANSDPLTGAYNRRFLQSYLGAALKGGETDRFDRTVLILDLDHFKKANDEFGHAAGDAILRDLVRRCQSRLAEDDVMCRLGGDEFVIITSSQSAQQGMDLAEALIEVFQRQPFVFEGQSMPVTTSIGVVSAVSNQCTVSDVLRMADQALYQAKKAGRNRAVFFDPDQATPFRHGPSMEPARERTE